MFNTSVTAVEQSWELNMVGA